MLGVNLPHCKGDYKCAIICDEHLKTLFFSCHPWASPKDDTCGEALTYLSQLILFN